MKRDFIISIVTPSYNQGEFLEDTIRSVLKQKGDFYIDYIIQDGGSRDSSIEIIKKYEKLLRENCDKKVIDDKTFYTSVDSVFEFNKCLGISFNWVSEPDGGQINALNKGFEKSIGDILAWINSDDYYLDENVFSLIKDTYLQDTSKLLLTADGSVVDRNGKEIWQHLIGRINVKELVYLDYHVFQPSTFFHASLLTKHKFNGSYKSTFDADFFISIINSTDFVKLSKKISAFRMYGENITDDKKLKMRAYRERIDIMRKYSDSKIAFSFGKIYHFCSYVLQSRCQNRAFLNKLYTCFMIFFKALCYKIILNERYSDRYLLVNENKNE